MTQFTRRETLALLLAGPSILACDARAPRRRSGTVASPAAEELVLAVEPLQRIWQTSDPFLFCAHHLDAYPPGNELMGPARPLDGRDIGQDFAQKDGWNMYHGDTVPGFPRHPHRGFETVTVVRTGLLDHADSLGATARYGEGDVQWLTAGRGIQHAEMFPLVRRDGDNPLELFQIWLNLPAASKMVDPHFSMLWSPKVPKVEILDDAGRSTTVTVIAGAFETVRPPAPPPNSYASHVDAAVAIWTLRMSPGARLPLPPADVGTERSLYLFRGDSLGIAGASIPAQRRVRVRAQLEAVLEAGPTGAEILVLQGRPIGEPIARHGPFVMNTESEIRQAYADYQRTQFGGWPWTRDDHVHPRDHRRFAQRPGSAIETPT